LQMVSLRRRARDLIERLTRTRIFRKLPRGVDVVQDVAASLPVFRAHVVFDVGANAGQSAQAFLDEFPEARVFCFEPVAETFRILQRTWGNDPRIECYKMALGSAAGTATMALVGNSDMYFVLGQSGEAPPDGNLATESVEMTTLDEFCRRKNVEIINFLKIDTEGGDLDVLQGATGMLAEHRIDLVQVEAGLNPGNSRHVSFEALKSFLECRRYFLFGVYEQVGEWPTGEPHLRRANPVFVSENVIRTNRIHSPGLS